MELDESYAIRELENLGTKARRRLYCRS